MLPFSKGLMDTLAPPGASTQTVELSRPAQAPGSLHAPLTEETETLLLGGMQDLRVDAVEKQRELEEQLVAVAARRDAALQRLTGSITPQREARLIRQRVALEVALGSLDAELSQAISSAFQRHDEVLAEPAERLERLGGVEEDFYFRQVPMLFEAQCRASVDTMEGERQALQLNNATIHAREQTISERMDRHEQSYRSRAAAEQAERIAQYASLNAAFSVLFTRVEDSARSAAARYPAQLEPVAAASAAEATARAAADAEFAATMHTTLTRLRALALEVYGLEESDVGEGES